MWEVYSLGKVPWKGLSPIEIRDLIVGGERLGRPERCPSDVFRLVQTCWKDNPQDRPSFADIYNRIQQVSGGIGELDLGGGGGGCIINVRALQCYRCTVEPVYDCIGYTPRARLLSDLATVRVPAGKRLLNH